MCRKMGVYYGYSEDQSTKEVQLISNHEFAKNLIDYVTENKLLYVVAYLQGIVVLDETPNTATILLNLTGNWAGFDLLY